jgi:hypothetical protein
MMEDTTYLEEFLNSVELLPNGVRRDFELLRKHDKESIELVKEVHERKDKILSRAKRIKTENNFANEAVILSITSYDFHGANIYLYVRIELKQHD